MLPSTVFNQRRFEYLRCCECETIYVDPMPTDADFAAMYSVDYHDQHYFSESEQRGDLFDRLEREVPKRTLLDYGCGDGRFVAFARSRGWEVHGVDFDSTLVDRLRGMYPDAAFDTVDALEAQPPTPEYGLVHLGDVFEHLRAPLDVLRALRRRMVPGGLLFIEGPLEANPNLVRFILDAYFAVKPRADAAHPPNHLVFTNRRNQLDALERLGIARTIMYSVDEAPWPMPSDWRRLSGIRDAAKFALGQVSLRTSSLVPGWGNRFIFVGEPTPEAAKAAP